MKLLSYEDLQKLNHHKQVLFACFCAEQVVHLVKEEHKEVCKKAIDTAYLSLEGKASEKECSAAYNVAYNAHASCAAASAASNAARSAVYAAVYAAAYASDAACAGYAAANAGYAASYAADATASTAHSRLAAIEAQWAFYDQLLNSDKYFEEVVLFPETKD